MSLNDRAPPSAAPAACGRCCQQEMRLRQGGYTLLELMVVIVLISGLAGIGLAMLTRTGNDLETATSLVRDFARLARSHARFYRAPARVVLDPPPKEKAAEDELRSIEVMALQPVVEWNFEGGRASGSRGFGGDLGGAVIDDGGRFGMGLFPDADEGRSGLTLDVRTLAAFDLREGFLVRCDVKLDERAAGTVLRLGEAFELQIDLAGRARGEVTLARQAGQAGRRIVLQGARRIPLRTWVKLELSVDGQRARLLHDFLEEASEPVRELCYRDPEAQFVISDGGRPVRGAIDTVEVFAFQTVASQELPEFVEIPSGPPVLHFDAEGMIDRRAHSVLPVYRLVLEQSEEVVRFERGGLPR